VKGEWRMVNEEKIIHLQKPESLRLEKVRMFDSAEEVENILRQLKDISSRYGMATRADLMDIVGVVPRSDDYRHGWLESTLNDSARVVQTPLGYFIELPASLRID